MSLAVTATVGGTYAERATLAISGADAPITVVYTADWSAGLDSWSGASDGPDPAAAPASAFGAWLASGIAYSDQYVKRTIAGLTIGHRYRVVATAAAINDPALVYLVCAGMTAPDPEAVPPAGSIADWVDVVLEFTATAPSHELRVRRSDDTVSVGAGLTITALSVTEIPVTGIGVTIQRTDANGTRYVRQAAGSLPDAGGALTVYDEEFALTGTVTWVVRDASGATASAALTMSGYPAPLLSAVGYPGRVVRVARVDDYDEARTYGEARETLAVIGRADPLIIERGDYAWSLRAGRLTLYAPDYAAATAIRDLYLSGRVVMLRQPTHRGLDLYHVASDVTIHPSDLAAAGWRWQLEVRYQETAWPDGVLQGVYGWSYADLAAAYLAYYNLPGLFDTYADLKAGP